MFIACVNEGGPAFGSMMGMSYKVYHDTGMDTFLQVPMGDWGAEAGGRGK